MKFIAVNLPYLFCCKIKKHLRFMSRKNNLILFWQSVQNLTGDFLQLWMKICLGLFNHNDIWCRIIIRIYICFKQRQNIYTPESFSHWIKTVVCFSWRIFNYCFYIKQFIRIKFNFITDFQISPTVFWKIRIKPVRKCVKVQAEHFILHESACLNKCKLLRLFSVDYAHTVKALTAFLCTVEYASVSLKFRKVIIIRKHHNIF